MSVNSNADQYLHSSLREGLIEHLLVGELLRHLWLQGVRDFEVLRPTTDAAGYDVVMAAGGVLRHIQLKASMSTGSTARQGINTALARHPSGCVIWAIFDPTTMKFNNFLWFGGAANTPLPDLGDKVVKHTKANALGVKTVRPNLRSLAKGRFERLDSIAELSDRLFKLG